MSKLTLSIVIPTYRRERVLIETLEYLLDIGETTKGFLELLLVDQTPRHEPDTERVLSMWSEQGTIRWLRPDEPHITRSMNLGLVEARGDIVLFTDDDIIPNGNLIKEHLVAHRTKSDVWAVVGQVLESGQSPESVRFIPEGGHLKRYLNFPFWSTQGAYVENAMAGNLSVRRNKALRLGGFDENFTPPVAIRFETEFAKRITRLEGKIWFEPKASIHHLRELTGGTRSKGHDLSSPSPIYGTGDFYFALKCGNNIERLRYILHRFLWICATRFHAKNPWYIPVKLIGEARAFIIAYQLYRQGPVYISKQKRYQ